MALDDEIYGLRLEKLKKIEALGQPTYRSQYEFTHTIPQILAEYCRRQRNNWKIRASRCALPDASWPSA